MESPCILCHMPSSRADSLRWNAPEVAKLMARKHIPHREELARRIRRPANSVRRSFDDRWDGEATGPLVVAIARELKVDSRKLIHDPRRAS